MGKYRESTASAFAERSAYKTKYDSSLHEMTSLRIDSGMFLYHLPVEGYRRDVHGYRVVHKCPDACLHISSNIN